MAILLVLKRLKTRVSNRSQLPMGIIIRPVLTGGSWRPSRTHYLIDISLGTRGYLSLGRTKQVRVLSDM